MPPSGVLPRGAGSPAVVEGVVEGGWGKRGWPPLACPVPGSRSQCSRMGIVSVCREGLEAERLNLKAEVTGRLEVVVGVAKVCKDHAAVAAADGATAAVGAAAAADAGTAYAGAVGPALLPPPPQSGPRAPAPRQAPCHYSLLHPRPLPASAAAAAAASSAARTMSHTSGSRDWCSSRWGPPSLAGGPG